MNKLMMILFLPIACSFFACHTEEEETEMTDNITMDTTRVKAVDYIPPNTNESSMGHTKRKRKFYIR